MKFGGKQSMADKVKVASRDKSGKAKDKKLLPPAKVRPVLKKDEVGFKITKKL